MDEVYVGEVMHYYAKIGVAALALTERLAVEDVVHFRSPEKREIKIDFEQKVASMEIEHRQVQVAGPGQSVAIRVKQKVRPRDRIYRKLPE